MPSSLLELQPAAYLTLLICYLEKASYLLFNTTVGVVSLSSSSGIRFTYLVVHYEQ